MLKYGKYLSALSLYEKQKKVHDIEKKIHNLKFSST